MKDLRCYVTNLAKGEILYPVKQKIVWTIVIDASTNCPNCDHEMETVLQFYPRNRKVAGCTRRQLQHKGFDFWLDKADYVFDACPHCLYEIR
jgi:hypothetical protein